MALTQKKIEIKNKRAEHDYFVLDTYNAGIVLCGTEIKSIRAGKAGLTDSFCYIRDGEIWVKNVYIAEYFYGSFYNHEARRDRKLLLNRREIRRLAQETKNPGLSIVPLLLYIDENNRAKLKIGLVRGKKEYDKRQTLKGKGRQKNDGGEVQSHKHETMTTKRKNYKPDAPKSIDSRWCHGHNDTKLQSYRRGLSRRTFQRFAGTSKRQ